MRAIEICPVCGHVAPITHHHPARRENDKEFVLDVCMPDHYSFFTPWHETSGITPGISRLGASTGGTAQYLTLMSQRRGYSFIAEILRGFDSALNDRNGKRDLKWARPRRVGSITKPGEEMFETIATAAKTTARLWNRILDYPELPEGAALLVLTSVAYYNAIAEHPEEWIEYINESQYEYPILFDVPAAFQGRNYAQFVVGKLLDDFVPHATAFIRYVERELIAA